MSWIGCWLVSNLNEPRVLSKLAFFNALLNLSWSLTSATFRAEINNFPVSYPWDAYKDGNRPYSFWKSWTNFLLALLSRSFDHWEVFLTPRAASPTAFKIPWSNEKAGPMTGRFIPDWDNCFINEIPIPPGKKKKILSALDDLIWAISAA